MGNTPALKMRCSSHWIKHNGFRDVLFLEPNLASENGQWLYHSRRRRLWISCVATGLMQGWHYCHGVNHRAGVEVLAQTKSFVVRWRVRPQKRKNPAIGWVL